MVAIHCMIETLHWYAVSSVGSYGDYSRLHCKKYLTECIILKYHNNVSIYQTAKE